MNKYQIECFSLNKRYSTKNQIINGVSNINLKVDQNELVLLKGRSGAGKSTLLNLMCGLIKPTSGKVVIENNCITELSNNSISSLLLNKIGIIFQTFNLLPTYNVYENIEIALFPKGIKQDKIKKIIIPLLDQFQLIDKLQFLPSELSVGQQQKVAIIRTLVKLPSIIFADEPTGSVDEETASEIIEHLLYLKREKQITLIVATHGSFPEAFADRIINIENGHIEN